MNRNFFVDRVFQLFFEGEGGGGGIGDVSDIPNGEAGDLDIMGRGDAAEGEGEEEEPEGESEEEPAAGEEGVETFDEDEEEGEEEEEEELDENGKPKVKAGEEEEFKGRPTLTDLKKKYPNIFKEFPDLREVLFRENEFGKHFGSVEEASSAAGRLANFNLIETALMGGDTTPIIEQLERNAPEALAAMVDNFLPSILQKSQDLYLRATVPIVEQLLHNSYLHGKKTNDANLMRSAQWIANFMFGKPEIPDPARRNRSNEPHPAEQKLQEERETWAKTRFAEASTEVNAGIEIELDTEILKGFSLPQGASEKQKKSFMSDVKREIDLALAKDEAFGKSMKALWKRAADANYPRDQRASIKSAFLARAKALVPSVRTRLRAEWFGVPAKGERVNTGGKNESGQQPKKKREIPGSGAAAGRTSNRPPRPEEVDYSKTSDADLIAGRFVRRK